MLCRTRLQHAGADGTICLAGAAYMLPPAASAAERQQLMQAATCYAGAYPASVGAQPPYTPPADQFSLRQPAHILPPSYAEQMQQQQVQQQPSAAAYPGILGAAELAAAPWPATAAAAAAAGAVSCTQAGWSLDRAGWQQPLPPQSNWGVQQPQQQQPCLWAGALAAAAAADRRTSVGELSWHQRLHVCARTLLACLCFAPVLTPG